MVRITTLTESAARRRLKIEGSLRGDYVEVLRRAVRESGVGSGSVVLDLTGVAFVNRDAAALLRTLQREGAVLDGASPFVAGQLQEYEP